MGLSATLGSLALIPVLFYEKRIKREKAARMAGWNIAKEEAVETA